MPVKTLRDPIPEHHTVAVVGLGYSGRAAARLLHRLGKNVIVTDSSSDADPQDVAEFATVRLGQINVDGATAAILSPGVNPEWPKNQNKKALAPLWTAISDGLEVHSEVVLAANAFDGKILTVGGTDGKSTTAKLIHHLTTAMGVHTILGGNSWTALSDVVIAPENALATTAIIEVSAFQLCDGHLLRPDVALLTNVAQDHLDYYADEHGYVRAKKYVLDHLGADSHYVFFAGDARLRRWAHEMQTQGVSVHGYDIATTHLDSDWNTTSCADRDGVTLSGHFNGRVSADMWRLAGTHNRKNLAGALVAAGLITGNDPTAHASVINTALGTFTGLPHRTAFVRELDGVAYYNDSKATNVHAALAGLGAFERPVVAIVGGVDKQLALEPLIDVLKNKAHAVVVIGEFRSRFLPLAQRTLKNVNSADSLQEAVKLARALATPGMSVVLSPACSSFDMFESFEQRGELFEAIVHAES